MGTATIGVIAGLIVGLFVGISQYGRVNSGANLKVIRNPDGSVFGGLVKVIAGVVILWFTIGFAVSYAIVSGLKWVF